MRNTDTRSTAEELAEKFRNLSTEQQKAAYAFLWGFVAASEDNSPCDKAIDYARRTF